MTTTTAIDQREVASTLGAGHGGRGELAGPHRLLNQLTATARSTSTGGRRRVRPRAATAGIPAPGGGPCSPRSGRSPSRCPATPSPRSTRRSSSDSPRLTRIDEIVLSLSAKGLTTGEIAAPRGRVRSYGVEGPMHRT